MFIYLNLMVKISVLKFNKYRNGLDFFASERSHVVCNSLSRARDSVFFSHGTVTFYWKDVAKMIFVIKELKSYFSF